MADKSRSSTVSGGGAPALAFEKQIFDLEQKIAELEALSDDRDLGINSEIRPLRKKLDDLIARTYGNLTPWQQVQVARSKDRPLAMDFIRGMTDDFMELHGDRDFRDDAAIFCGLGSLGGRRVMFIAHRKGRDTKQKIECNFGCAHPEGYRKALRKMRLAEKFGIPIITLINTPGAYPGIGAEERGQAWAIAENLMAMFAIRVPIICLVIGEGGSGGALGIGIGDRVMVLEHAYYSVITPEGCAAILWKDAKRAPEAAQALKLSSRHLAELGVVDEIVAEPLGAAHRDPGACVQHVRERILHHLAELEKTPIDELLAVRYDKFRDMGTVFSDGPVQVATAEPPAAPDPKAPAEAAEKASRKES